MAIKDTNNNELVSFSATASAVNEITVKNAATANAPEISATGTDTNIDLKLTPKGSGNLILDGLEFPNADGSANQVLQTNGSGVLSFATPGGGKVLQVVQATSTTAVTVNHTTSYTDLLTGTITPTSATSKILIIAAITGSSAGGSVRSYLELTRATTAIFSGTSVGSRVACSSMFQIPYGMIDANITYLDSPTTTSATTYRIRTRMGPSDIGDTHMNRSSTDSDNGNYGRGTSSITFIEIGA